MHLKSVAMSRFVAGEDKKLQFHDNNTNEIGQNLGKETNMKSSAAARISSASCSPTTI